MKALAPVLAAVLLLGCLTVNWENQTITASVPLSGNETAGFQAVPGVNVSEPAPSALAAPDKVSACVFGGESLAPIFGGTVNASGKLVALEAKSLSNSAKAGDLEGCAFFALLDGSEGRYLDRTLRTEIRGRVLAGAGLIVSQQAATLVHGDAAVRGWDLVLGDVVPVGLPEEQSNLTVNATFVFTKPDAAFVGLSDFNVTGVNVTEVNMGGGETVALLRLGPFQTSVAYDAVVRGGAGRGSVYYISFAPQDAPLIYRAVAEFLARDYLEKNFG